MPKGREPSFGAHLSGWRARGPDERWGRANAIAVHGRGGDKSTCQLLQPISAKWARSWQSGASGCRLMMATYGP